MSITAVFRLIDKGQVLGTQTQEFDTIQRAEREAHDGMDVFTKTADGVRVNGRRQEMQVVYGESRAVLERISGGS